MWFVHVALLVAAAGIALLGAQEARDLDRRGGVLLRRERRRVILTSIFAAGMLVWPVVFLSMPRPASGSVRWAAGAALLWPLVLLGADLVVTRTHVPTQEEMEARAQDTRGGGNWIIGAVFASGMLLAVLNRTSSGHFPESAKVMLLGMLGIIAFLLPTPGSAPAATLTWTVAGVQRVVLHGSVGLFILACALAWGHRGTGVPRNPTDALMGTP